MLGETGVVGVKRGASMAVVIALLLSLFAENVPAATADVVLFVADGWEEEFIELGGLYENVLSLLITDGGGANIAGLGLALTSFAVVVL